MQVKTTARRLLQAGLLNPTAPASRRPEGSASRAASSGCSDRVEISREGRTAALSGAGTPEPPAEKPNQPDGFDFTGVDWETFDWDSWEPPTLEKGEGHERWMDEIDQDEYRKKYEKELTDEQVLEQLAELQSDGKPPKTSKSKGGIVVKGIHDVAARFSKCCTPVPGDEIVGFVTRGRGISIHRTDCVNIINLSEEERYRLIDAEWSPEVLGQSNQLYTTELRIFANNRNGILVDVTRLFTEAQITISTISARASKKGTVTIDVVFEIKDTGQLSAVVGKIQNLQGVLDIERTTG